MTSTSQDSSLVIGGRTLHSVRTVGLKRDTLGGVGVFAQGLAAAAPSVALASVPIGLFTAAGKGAVWAGIIGLVLVVLIAATLTFQSSRTVSSGSLGTYAGNGLGPAAGFAASWSLIVAYTAFGITAILGAALYLNSFLTAIGVPASIANALWFQLGIALIASAVAIYIPFRGAAVAARLELILEILALATIAVIIVASYVSYGPHVDTAQFSLGHLANPATYVAAVYAVGSYAGFESVASLGGEARNAHRNITRSLLLVVIILGVLYTVTTYPQVLQFHNINTNNAILPAIAASAGVAWVDPLVSIAVAASYTVFAIAVINAAARAVLTLAKEGALPAFFGRVHSTHKTPVTAILIIGALSVVFSVVATVSTAGRLIFDIYAGYVATWGFLAAYLLAVIATPIWLYRIKALTPLRTIVSILALLGLGLVVFFNFVPVPAFPYSILPAIFAALLVIGLLRYWYLKARRPEVAARVGTIQTISDIEQERLAALGLIDLLHAPADPAAESKAAESKADKARVPSV